MALQEDFLTRKENENKISYMKRIIMAKLNQEIDTDYVELAPLVFEQELSSSECRKRMYGCKKVFEIMDTEKENIFINDNIGNENVLTELQLQKIELEKERKKIQTTKLEYNKLLRENARQEMLFEEIRKSIKTVEVSEFNPIVTLNDDKKAGVLSFADLHFGKIFKSLTNEYSEDIAYQRMNNLMSKTLEICKKEEINHLYILNCADSIEGMCLRISQLQNLQMGIVDMTIKFAKFMTNWLNELSKYIYITYLHVSASNHSQIRPLGTTASQFPKEDMERIIITYIHDVLKNNDRIDIPMFDNDFVDFSIFKYNIIAEHGNQIKNIKNTIKDLSMKHRKFYDYCYTAHLHHSESITVGEGYTNNCEVLLTPSIMGTDEYADSLLTGSKAGARLDIFTDVQGKAITYDIILN